jgi:hypothetical protein
VLGRLKVALRAEAYQRLRKRAAPGVDEVTWEEYGERLYERLLDLQDRIHRGTYHPQPVKRVHIPRGNGQTRPLGIPSLEDKVVQQAVRMVIEPIYEAESDSRTGFDAPVAAPCARCTGRGDRQEGQLATRCRHPVVLRHKSTTDGCNDSSSTASRTHPGFAR